MSDDLVLVRGRIFNPLSRSRWEYYEKGAMLITPQGRIHAVGDFETLKSREGITNTLDFSESLILPGFIDCHTHLPQLPIRGLTAGTLLEWLKRYAFPIEEAFANPEYAARLSTRFFEQFKANGTTTALVLSSVHEESTHRAFEAAGQSGMRVIMGKVMMDQNVPDTMGESTEASIQASERLATAWHRQHDDLLRYAFTPRYALSCSMPLMEAVSDLCQRFPESYIHSHLAENRQEIEEIQALYENRLTYTQIYEKAHCLGPRTILAHGIHLSFEDLSLLRSTQTRIAHCPSSNFFLKSGCFNLPAYWHHQIPFALATDIGAGPDLSMFRVMRAMDEMQMSHFLFVKPVEAFYYATLAGAEVLSLDSETGNLLPGKSADFIVVSLPFLQDPEVSDWPIEAVLSRLMYLGDIQLIQKTFVRGQEIYSNKGFAVCV